MRKMILSAMALICMAAPAWVVNAQDAEKVETLAIGDGAYTLKPPADWKKVEVANRMIQYEFRAPKDGKEGETARITVMPATGGIEQNIDRWKSQFDGVKDGDSTVEKKEIAGCTVHFVDIKGTFKDTMAAGGPKKYPSYRMLGTIIETKKSGTVFLKMTGPQDTVEKLNEGWLKMLEEMVAK